jgi:hypothetical protein
MNHVNNLLVGAVWKEHVHKLFPADFAGFLWQFISPLFAILKVSLNCRLHFGSALLIIKKLL